MAKQYYRQGLEIGWLLAKAKKLPPKPCLVCGAPVHYKKSTADRAKYCSVACKNESLVGRKYIRTKPLSGKIVTCETCGKEFYRTPSELKRGKRRYCSFACRNKGDYLGQNLYGANHYRWKGGRIKSSGYIYVLSPEHPLRNSGNRVAEHRLVIEQSLGRYLLKNESVHHRNGVKDDNRIENLQIIVQSPHTGEVDCPYCQKTFRIR